MNLKNIDGQMVILFWWTYEMIQFKNFQRNLKIKRMYNYTLK